MLILLLVLISIGIDDLDLDIDNCRKYCYTDNSYVYQGGVGLCNECEKIIHKHLDKYQEI